MADEAGVQLPWVLVRAGVRPVRFLTRELGMRFYDQLRFNRPGGAAQHAALFGPGREAWFCLRWTGSEWGRDDERRRRESLAQGEEANP